MGTGGFELTLGTLYGVDAQGVPVSVGTALAPASAVVVTLTNVDLWVGAGGALANTGNNDVTDATTFLDDAVVEGDLGFHGTVGTMQLVALTDPKTASLTDDVSYLALSVSDLNASLVGLEACWCSTPGMWMCW